MKKAIVLLSVLLSFSLLQAQTPERFGKVSAQVNPDSPGEVVHFVDQTITPDMLKKLNEVKRSESRSVRKVSADNLGDIKNFWVNNSDPEASNKFESREFKLMRKGSVSQLWFATEDLNNGRLNESVADTMFAYLENKTNANSYNPNKGVIALGNEIFGNPPNFDGDGLSDVLVCDIRDGWTPGNGYIAGFFYGVDQYTQADLNSIGYSAYKSNERDVIYIDSYPGIFYNNQVSPTAPLSTLSHEYQHLIHFNYDGNEISFINEGQACFASLLVGYTPHGSVSSYLADTNVPIFIWRSGNDVLKDYGRAASFTSYIWDHYGFQNAGKLTQSSLTANAGVDQVLTQLSAGYNFSTLVANWHTANAVSDVTVNSLYGYSHPIIKNWKATRSVMATPNQSGTVNVSNGAAKNIAFQGVKDITVKVTFSSGVAKVITKKGATNTVTNLTTGVNWTSSSGVTFDEIVVLMINTNASATGTSDSGFMPFTYNVSGATAVTTLKDYGAAKYYWPVPYLNDSQVGRMGFSHKYTPTSKGKLTTMRLYTTTGTDRETGDPIQVKGSGTLKLCVYSDNAGMPGQLINSKNIPFSSIGANWNDFDVSDWDYQFDANTTFHVAYEFNVQTVDPAINVVPLRQDDGTGKQNVSKIWTGTAYANWPFAETSGGQNNIWNEIIYALVTGVEDQHTSTMVETFTLSQNYPNPFNPSTVIKFILSKPSDVQLTVFDVLGREMMTLVNQNLPIGEHQATVDGAHLTSGMYFYQLKVGNQTETKRMMLIK